ncbi:MAG TPA: hypothetical protein DCQ49_01430 [Methylophaga sp.]|nr:hypothetical protein [Methylophaga sp.]
MQEIKKLPKYKKDMKKVFDIAFNIVAEGEAGMEDNYSEDESIYNMGTHEEFRKAVDLLNNFLINLNNELYKDAK